MANSTRKRPATKPDKPYPDFPLFPHRNGQWAKKVRGKLLYFGSWNNLDGAMDKWLDQRDDLLAGRKPRVACDGLTVKDLANRFLTAKKILVDGGELSPRTWADYHVCCGRVVTAFGGGRLVSDLAADDFEALRATLGATRGPVLLKVELQRIRSVFKYGYAAGLIDRPVRFGPMFKPPSKRVLKQDRLSKGRRMFEAAEIRQMLDAARPQLRGMILLGINAGFGNHDCASLPKSALDMDRGWVDFPRPKTSVDRRCPLWPETVAALTVAITTRPTPRDPADGDLVFLTQRGNRWVRLKGNTDLDSLSSAMGEVLTKLGIKRLGLGFYGLRHSFRTIADETLDQPAANLIMGHTDPSMAAVYRDRISDARLRAVTDHIHAWLFGDSE